MNTDELLDPGVAGVQFLQRFHPAYQACPAELQAGAGERMHQDEYTQLYDQQRGMDLTGMLEEADRMSLAGAAMDDVAEQLRGAAGSLAHWQGSAAERAMVEHDALRRRSQVQADRMNGCAGLLRQTVELIREICTTKAEEVAALAGPGPNGFDAAEVYLLACAAAGQRHAAAPAAALLGMGTSDTAAAAPWRVRAAATEWLGRCFCPYFERCQQALLAACEAASGEVDAAWQELTTAMDAGSGTEHDRDAGRDAPAGVTVVQAYRWPGAPEASAPEASAPEASAPEASAPEAGGPAEGGLAAPGQSEAGEGARLSSAGSEDVLPQPAPPGRARLDSWATEQEHPPEPEPESPPEDEISWNRLRSVLGASPADRQAGADGDPDAGSGTEEDRG